MIQFVVPLDDVHDEARGDGEFHEGDQQAEAGRLHLISVEVGECCHDRADLGKRKKCEEALRYFDDENQSCRV
eukprot:CAMPEP_0176051910 /NCGR_PEP_ID=MMETSP0120_2-20121206/25808_1 /TAXON_ID=160619 /ORGANISM="Kryptoperidinium foliaceum, Strain CCMP 1326" /LENGTH=72 /DNA_ID=CAMNT_0017385349 /DNA_START=76 /DNA_END=294 /DNA_ORIENTATION=-